MNSILSIGPGIKGKLLFILVLLPLISGLAHGRSSLTIYDEEGVPFTISLNGVQRGPEEASTRIRLDSLPAGEFELRIAYPDTNIPALEQKLSTESNVSYTYSLRPEEDGQERSLALVSRIVTGTEQNGEREAETGTGAGIEVPIPRTDSSFIRSYKGESSCSDPLGRSAFKKLYGKVEGIIFEKERIRTIKERIAERCLLSVHVATLMRTLDYEDNRLDLAKYAYGRTFDLNSYDEVRQALNFEKSRERLDGFLQEMR
jgi:hypothetical protein